jgi:MerC mercury resistance protein
MPVPPMNKTRMAHLLPRFAGPRQPLGSRAEQRTELQIRRGQISDGPTRDTIRVSIATRLRIGPRGDKVPGLAHSHSKHSSAPALSWLPNIDRLAIVLSVLCAVHCVLTPLVLLGLPLLGSHEFESGMRLLLGSLGVVAVGLGTVTHRNWRAAPLLAAGLALFVGLEVWGIHGGIEALLSVVAAGFLVAAHVQNWLSCRAVRA